MKVYSYSLEDFGVDFIKSWKKAGDQVGKMMEKGEGDIVYQFFDYFVVFNYIYEHFYFINKGEFTNHFHGRRDREADKIEFFITCLWDELRKEGFEPWAFLSENSPMVVSPVDNGKWNKNKDGKINLNKKDKDTAIDILMNIYGIRCNLFHGHKRIISLTEEHDNDSYNDSYYSKTKQERDDNRNESLLSSSVPILNNILESAIKIVKD